MFKNLLSEYALPSSERKKQNRCGKSAGSISGLRKACPSLRRKISISGIRRAKSSAFFIHAITNRSVSCTLGYVPGGVSQVISIRSLPLCTKTRWSGSCNFPQVSFNFSKSEIKPCPSNAFWQCLTTILYAVNPYPSAAICQARSSPTAFMAFQRAAAALILSPCSTIPAAIRIDFGFLRR